MIRSHAQFFFCVFQLFNDLVLPVCNISSVLAEILAGKKADVNVGLAAYSRKIAGESSKSDFVVLLQLVHLLFTVERRVSEPSYPAEYLSLSNSEYKLFYSSQENRSHLKS